MGDDLYIAREFSNAALADISAMGAMQPRLSPDNIEQMSMKLASLQSGAKRLHARAIYQSAQIVIDGLTPNAVSQDGFDMRLLALSNLITQYADGLSEVENAQIQSKLETMPLEAPQFKAQTNSDANPEDLQILAKTTLTELMPFAQVGETSALQALMDYDFSPHAAVVVNAKPHIDAPQNHASTVKAPRVQVPQIPLEYVLRDAIQDALSIARMSGKTISISYDVGQTHIGEDRTTSLERRLCEGLRALILQSLPQDGIGHIDINLRGKNMVICSKHKAPRLLPQDLTARKTANGSEITFALIAKDKAAPNLPQEQLPDGLPERFGEPQTLALSQTTDPTLAIAAPIAPMITAETETQLRAQLGALLDGQDMPQAQSFDASQHELHLEDNIIVMTGEAAKKAKQDKVDTGEIGVGL